MDRSELKARVGERLSTISQREADESARTAALQRVRERGEAAAKRYEDELVTPFKSFFMAARFGMGGKGPQRREEQVVIEEGEDDNGWYGVAATVRTVYDRSHGKGNQQPSWVDAGGFAVDFVLLRQQSDRSADRNLSTENFASKNQGNQSGPTVWASTSWIEIEVVSLESWLDAQGPRAACTIELLEEAARDDSLNPTLAKGFQAYDSHLAALQG